MTCPLCRAAESSDAPSGMCVSCVAEWIAEMADFDYDREALDRATFDGSVTP